MEFRNLTPFAAMQYAMLDQHDVEKRVVVVKTGYQLQRLGDGTYRVRVRDDDAVPLCLEDKFSAKMNASSMREESDLAPFKPACDVIITAIARVPDGKPCATLPVSVTITNAYGKSLLSKQLQVTGSQVFQQHPVTKGWSLGQPDLFQSMPLNWENAFGGECRIEQSEDITNRVPDTARLSADQRGQHPDAPHAPLAHDVCTMNPLGRGYMTPWYARAKQTGRYPAPGISDARHLMNADDFSAQIAGDADMTAPPFQPAGFGIICRTWQPRLKLAGTYDDDWREKRHPYLPADFDFRYWNCAPADQQIPYPPLALSVSLEGVTSDGPLYFNLPDHVAFLLLRMKNGLLLPQMMHIDTLHIDTERLQVTVCWRALIAADAPVRVAEVRYETDPERLPEKMYPMLFPKKTLP